MWSVRRTAGWALTATPRVASTSMVRLVATAAAADAPAATTAAATTTRAGAFLAKLTPAQRQLRDGSMVVTPQFARPEMLPTDRDPAGMVPKGMGGMMAFVPEAQMQRTVRVFRQSRLATQSGYEYGKVWRVKFDDRQRRWANPLMGWTSSADPLGSAGLARMCKFDSKEAAVAFVERMGWKYIVEEPPVERNTEGTKGYDKNFLNYAVKQVLDTHPPGIAARKQFSHPERGRSTWVNLGQMATAKGTSTHNTAVKVTGVSQGYWAQPAKEVSKHDAKSWRSDNFGKAEQLARKLGK